MTKINMAPETIKPVVAPAAPATEVKPADAPAVVAPVVDAPAK